VDSARSDEKCVATLDHPSLKEGFSLTCGGMVPRRVKRFLRDTLLGSNAACRSFFDLQAIEDIVSRQEKGKLSGFQEVGLYWFSSFGITNLLMISGLLTSRRKFQSKSMCCPVVALDVHGHYVGSVITA